ncbi:hypothetical protein, partial [Escherichia coli]|uniref:hypothetical protein n=1 Tax=Escherichia coli TaxID=562 RepID=UPI002B24DA10
SRAEKAFRHNQGEIFQHFVGLKFKPQPKPLFAQSFLSMWFFYPHTPHKNPIFKTSINSYFN